MLNCDFQNRVFKIVILKSHFSKTALFQTAIPNPPSNTLNLNILEKNNIVCVSLVNATMGLNSNGEPIVPNLRNCT